MSNDDTGALCPNCGAECKIANLTSKPPIQSIYCTKCTWEANWKLIEGAWIKQ